MKKLFSWLLHPWLLAALGLLAIALLIWWVGPLVAVAGVTPLASELTRAVLIALIVGGYLAVKLVGAWQARRANDAVLDRLAPTKPAGADEPAEVRVLRERFEQGLAVLRTTRFDAPATGGTGRGVWDALSARVSKRYLYQLPWYIFIGAPGSGKTTALLNAGLRFPLAGQLGQDQARGVSGIAGTRNCDWWFTDEAVLIDTAGRYTTQDSDRDADRTAWTGFMALLKGSRPRQPVNGVLVTVSVTDLLTRSAAERARDAAAVRARVQELHEQLGVRFPIYLLVTKCDLLAGFTDYLGTLDRDQRAAPWGFTFPLDAQQRSDTSGLLTEFDLLERRLTDGLIERLQPERDVARRARIYAFPQQFNALRPVLKSFVDEVFAPSPFEAHPLLRGVYFISGTQEGTPLDRMLGTLARQWGLERAALPPNQASGRSYFLERLLREVVFAESALGGTDLKWERRRHLLALGGYAALGLIALTAAGLWWRSFSLNSAAIAQTDQRARALEEQLRTSPARQSSDVLALLPLLDAARDVTPFAPTWSNGLGLYQGDKLQRAAQTARDRLLTEGLLPRLALRVEEQLGASMGSPDLQYDVLKTYVMLHDARHFDPKWLRAYVQADWNTTLPRDVTPEQRRALDSHLDALLARGAVTSPLQVNQRLIDEARASQRQTTLAQRAYNRLRLLGVGADTPEFSATAAAGPDVTRVFVRASGKPLTDGIPGLYTYDGYHKGFSGAVRDIARELADEEPWVLGLPAAARPAALADPLGSARLTDEVRRLYLSDYAQRWSDYLADLRLRPTGTLPQAIEVAQVLAMPGGASPLKRLLQAVSTQTTLSRPPSAVAATAAQEAAKAAERTIKDRVLAPLIGDGAANAIAGAAQPGSAAENLEKTLVDDRFVRLRELVGAPDGKGPAPIDDAIKTIEAVHVHLLATQSAVQARTAPPPSATPTQAKALAAQLPPPLGAMLDKLAVSGTAAALDATRANLGSAIRAEIGEFCQKAIAGRYPFERGSARDVTQDDFARLFAPGGLMDQFMQKHLAAYVDTTTRPWSFRQLDGASMGLGSGALQQFQRAAEIRDVFFRAGSAVPTIGVDIKPVGLDAALQQVQLDVGGQVITHSAASPAPLTRVQWPSPRGSAQVRLSVTPPSPSGAAGLTTEGPWALLRLMDRLQITPGGGPERFTATYELDGRKVVFDVTSGSVQNPLRLPALRGFSCPTGL